MQKNEKKHNKITIIMLVLLSMVTAVTALVTESISESKNIVVTLINQEPDPVEPGNFVDVRFRIENKGAQAAEDVQIRIEPKFPFSIYWSEEKTKNIGTLAGGQRDDIGVREKFRLSVSNDATPGNNIVEFWYKAKGFEWVKAGDYNIDVRSRDAVLAINEIKTNPQTITPGSRTKVSFLVENLAGSVLKDIKLRLNVLTAVVTTTDIVTSELPFSPLGSGDEKTVQSIGPGESKEIVFDIFTDADAESKVYKVPYTLSYEDQVGSNFSRSGVVGLLVDSEPDLAVSLESTDIYTAGAKGSVSIEFVNKGFSDIKFLNVILKDSNDIDLVSSAQEYIGNLDSDDFESADFDIIVSGEAKENVRLPLMIEYRDANGKLYEKDIALNLPLYSGNDLKLRSNSKSSSPVGLIIIIAIVGGGVWWYRRRKKKKKA